MIEFVSQKRIYVQVFASIVFVFVISINISYSLQQARGILFSEESNMTYNLHMLFKMKANYSDLVTYDVQEVQPKDEKTELIKNVVCQNYEDSATEHFVHDSTGKSKFVYHMYDEEEYHPKTIRVPYSKSNFANGKWIKCSGDFLCPKPYLYYKHLLTFSISRGGKMLHWWGCKIDNKIGLTEPGAFHFDFNHSALNKWGYVYFFVKIPEDIEDGDELMLDVWNVGKKEIYMDNVCMDVYKGSNR